MGGGGGGLSNYLPPEKGGTYQRGGLIRGFMDSMQIVTVNTAGVN